MQLAMAASVRIPIAAPSRCSFRAVKVMRPASKQNERCCSNQLYHAAVPIMMGSREVPPTVCWCKEP